MSILDHEAQSAEMVSKRAGIQLLLTRTGLLDKPFEEMRKICPSMKVAFSNPGMKVAVVQTQELAAKLEPPVVVAAQEIWIGYLQREGVEASAIGTVFIASSQNELGVVLKNVVTGARNNYEVGAIMGANARKRPPLYLIENKATMADSYQRDSIMLGASRAVVEAIEGWHSGAGSRLDAMVSEAMSRKAAQWDVSYPTLFGCVHAKQVMREGECLQGMPAKDLSAKITRNEADTLWVCDIKAPATNGAPGWQTEVVHVADHRAALEVEATGQAMALWLDIRIGFEMFHWVAEAIGPDDIRSGTLVMAGITAGIRGAEALSGRAMSVWDASGIAMEITKRNRDKSNAERSEEDNHSASSKP